MNGGFKIESAWVPIALSPAVIWRLATGQLAESSGFGLAFKLHEASATTLSLRLDGSRIEPVALSVGRKGGVADIGQLIQRRVRDPRSAPAVIH